MNRRPPELMAWLKLTVRAELKHLSPRSRPKRILFDHLPKCAGTSLFIFLRPHYPRRKVFQINGYDPIASVRTFRDLPRRSRHKFMLVSGHRAIELMDDVHPECVRVTLIREPIDRIVSHYHYVRDSPEHYLHPAVMGSNMSLEEYATSGLSGELRNWYTTHFAALDIGDAERNPVEAVNAAVQTLIGRFDLVGFLDDFPAFIRALRREAKLFNEYPLQRLNVIADGSAAHTISATVRSVIADANSLDVEFYRVARASLGRKPE